MEAAVLYALIALAALAIHLTLRRRRDRRNAEARRESERQGLNEPPSLHPVVDPARCIGSGACVHACPEKALGIVAGKAVPISGSACIGHGACAAACPVKAIQLVFGTEKRGIDIPEVAPNFESNVPGLFIAGELGGMGLVRKAAEQGRQAIDHIRRRPRGHAELDVLIVGAGPAGISAGLAALEHKLRYRLIEQEDSLGGAVYHYPRQKITMTSPVTLALVGKVKVGEIAKEALLALWNDIVGRTGLQIRFQERMESLEPTEEGFVVHTNRGHHRAASVLLAIGRRGTPRKLEVPGEESAKVAYRLIDPQQYRGQHVLVVGGGDSALEAAIALADEPGTHVALSYRGESFSRVKEKNRAELAKLAAAGRVRLLLGTQVSRIEPTQVALDGAAEETTLLRNDAVIVCAGGVLPTALLQKAGVHFATKYGTA